MYNFLLVRLRQRPCSLYRQLAHVGQSLDAGHVGHNSQAKMSYISSYDWHARNFLAASVNNVYAVLIIII